MTAGTRADTASARTRVEQWAFEIRRIVLEESKRANVGHIGSSLCVVDLLAVLYADILDISHPRDPDRDRFVMSKGHAALALYAALHLRGWLSRTELSTYCVDGSLLGVHPDRAVPGVDFTTGSLGHGLAFGVGAALAARLQGSNRRVFVLLSDAECNEGSVWESVMFAAHARLANLVAIIDNNGQQALGYTSDVQNPSPLSERWSAFGWHMTVVDGHDHTRLSEALSTSSDRPQVVIADTIFGRGVSFMERKIAWHYWPMSETQYRQALEEIEQQACAVHSF